MKLLKTVYLNKSMFFFLGIVIVLFSFGLVNDIFYLAGKFLLLAIFFKMGPVGAFIAIPVAESVIAMAAYYYFKKGKWKEVKV